jgi:arylsulfatase A-like enzyme
VDEYIYKIWHYINTDPNYKGKTTLFVTNDHGRHEGSASGDFVNHGDSCEGCTHLMCYASGPDFKKGLISDNPRELIDISATIASLMGFTLKQGTGKIMEELLR